KSSVLPTPEEQYEPTKNQPCPHCHFTEPDCLRLIVTRRHTSRQQSGHDSKLRKRHGLGQHEFRRLSLSRHTLVRQNKERSLHVATRSPGKRLPPRIRCCVWMREVWEGGNARFQSVVAQL